MRTLLLPLVLAVGCTVAARPALGEPPATTRPTTVAAHVTTPAEHLGRPVGGDFTLADYNEVTAYYQLLAQQSPNVHIETVGKTTEGRDFLLVTISSQANLQNLETLKGYAKTIADPRGKTDQQKEAALRDGKTFVVMTPSMHSNEVAAVQMAMEYAYNLATSDEEPWKSARDNAVIFLTPTLNPDGLDHICEWYRKTVHTPYEGSTLPKLYQRYTGHDNNRDYFMLTQPETQILSRIMYKDVLPQILWDVHQQGGGGMRFFTPPYRDPMDPNIDPAIVTGINLLGTRAILDMTRDGLSGVACGGTYDMWWAGGNRSTPARHNMIGILTEAASCDLATPIFEDRTALKPPLGDRYVPGTQFVNPWPGGWWRVRDIIDYELSFGRSLLGTINREPRLWRELTMQSASRAVDPNKEGVKGWIIPSDNRDPTAVRRLVDALLGTGIEVGVADSEVSTDGRTYPAGSIVIRRDQPYGAHVKDLFEIQRYPETKPPYDVAGWTLPLLMGVQRVEVMQSLDQVKVTRVEDSAAATKVFEGADARMNQDRAGAIAISGDSSGWQSLVAQLQAGKAFSFVTVGPEAGLLMPGAATSRGVAPATQASVEYQSLPIRHMPRIGIYSPWSGSIDEGWLRWVFDSNKVQYVTVRNEELRAGELGKFLDVLIIADTSPTLLDNGRPDGTVPEELTGGLAPEGSIAIQDFVKTGGTLITFKSASDWAIRQFQIPLVDTTKGDAAKGFSCPGSVLRGQPAEDQPLTAGLPPTLPLFFANGLGWAELAKADRERLGLPETRLTTLLRYSPTELLMSGYVAVPSALEGKSAWVRVDEGKGHVHLFGFQPHYRAWTQATIPLIFRAAIFDARQ